MTPNRITKKRSRKFAVFLLLSLLSVWFFSATAAFGADARKGSFTVTLQDTQENGSHKVLPDVRLKLYKAGSMQEDNGAITFVPDTALASAGVDFGKLTTASTVADAAEKLAGVVGNSGISPLKAVTDADGIAVFSGLDAGMYLIIHDEPNSNLRVMPILLSIPYIQKSGSLLYDVQAFPKTIEPEPTETPDVTGTPILTVTPDVTGTPTPTELPAQTISPVPTSAPNWPSNIDDPKPPDNKNAPENQTSSAIKTGDETPITFYILLLITAFLLCAVTIRKKSQ